MIGAVDRERSRAWLAAGLGVESPFPWQRMLLERFVDGALPRAVDVPTGLGKTAIMGVWLVARAVGAQVPRRLVYVVDRRAVVDQATKVAERLRAFVDETPELKRALGLQVSSSLPISTLRGQLADNREWLADPAAPAIVVGTIDMIGSRLLFEGYGASPGMRPFHAGLLGADTLVVLDEAHLTPAFEALVEAVVRERARRDSERLEGDRVPPLHLISLSATGRTVGNTLALSDEDLRHPVVRERLDAPKRVVIRAPIDADATSLPATLAGEAWALSDEGRRAVRCIVFCDRRKDAQEVFAELGRLATRTKPERDIGRELLVGARRVHERTHTATWLEENGFVGGERVSPPKPLFVVATSAGEVGVDLDADHMVGDVVAWERIVQRLGRVNRKGKGDATVVIVPTTPDKATREALAHAEKLEGDVAAGHADLDAKERALVSRYQRSEASLSLLRRLASSNGDLDACPRALTTLKSATTSDAGLASQFASATTQAPLHPALERPLIEAWSMTSLREHSGRPEVQPWIRGWVDDEPRTRIVWRRWLPVPDSGSVDLHDAASFFEAAPPHMLEVLETSTAATASWLAARVTALADRAAEQKVAPAAPTSPEDQDPAETTTPADAASIAALSTTAQGALLTDGVVAFVLARRDEKIILVTGEDVTGNRDTRDRLEAMLREGTLIIDVRLGGLAQGLLDEGSDSASDVGDMGGLPFRVRAVTSLSDSNDDEKAWRQEISVAVKRDSEGQARRWLLVETDIQRAATTEEGRSVSTAQLLTDHQEWAERAARDLASRLGLTLRYVEMLALAARIHDEGKQAERWQRAFNAPRDGIYGKTRSRPNQGILDGYRHELGSFLRAERDPRIADLEPELRDLCLHLIVSHHGYARPTIRTKSCEGAPPSVMEKKAGEIALRFVRLQERWGAWELAWWECLLRGADQRASRANDERRSNDG
ncbi:MAG: type I-U CRISPR-associated helicase/endonuclease Cas3 [Myxococcota bacterium]|nr:type I-U CRISPR-associated helicase/endonuclease Cas3 [Myxococcota bacterium]